MLHNFLLVAPGAADEVGLAAMQMGLTGQEQNYVPESDKVLFHTNLLEPSNAEIIYFVAPSEPGEYPFVCTFPGHYMVMRGILTVTAE